MAKIWKDAFGKTINNGEDVVVGIFDGTVTLHSGIVFIEDENTAEISYNSWDGEIERCSTININWEDVNGTLDFCYRLK